MEFLEQVGTRYLEGKANAAPQQIESFAKKQFFTSNDDKGNGKAKSRKGSVPATNKHNEPEDEEEEEEGEEGESEYGEYEEREKHKRVSPKKASKGRVEQHQAASEKDLEIARLRGELEESRRGGRTAAAAAAATAAHAPSKKKDEHKAAAQKESPARKLRRSRSTKVFDDKGIKVVGGALVADAASRRHREKRPEHSTTKELGKTVDGKGLGVASGALVAEKSSKARSKSEHAAREPIIVEAAPRSKKQRRRSAEEEEDEEDEGSECGGTAHDTFSQRPSKHQFREEDDEHGSEYRSVPHKTRSRRARRQSVEDARSEYSSIAPSRPSHSRHSFAEEGSELSTIAPSRAPHRRRESQTLKSEIGSSIMAAPPTHRKSNLAPRGRRPSTESAIGSMIAPPTQVEAIRRRQRSRGQGLMDAEIDTPAPETPSLRALSRRRREAETRHERGGDRGEEEAAHLPERRKSVLHERVGGGGGGEGSVVDILEARSVPFRPQREERGGSQRGPYNQEKDGYREKEMAWEREREREMDIVEVMEEKRQRGPVVRRIDMGERAARGGSEVELMRKEGGRTVYRVR